MFREKIKAALKIRESRIAVCIGVVTVLCFFLVKQESLLSEDGSVFRKEYGEGSSLIDIDVSIEGVGQRTVELEIEGRKYTALQCEEMFSEAVVILEDILPGKSESLSAVKEDLKLPGEIEGYPFEIDYKSHDRNAITDEGKLIAEASGSTEITAYFSYNDWQKEEDFTIIYSPKLTITPEEMLDELEETLVEIEKGSREDEKVILPDNIRDIPVSYKDTETERNYSLLLLGVMSAVLVILAGRKDREKEVKERKSQIEKEYSVLVQKMVMYLSTGMSIRNVMGRIYADAVSQGRDNPIYEDMYILLNELKTGVSEKVAYENFAKRTGVPEIKRFTTLLSQNLKTGSTNLSGLLKGEASKAFKTREQRARTKGEEAGTKLIVPMVMLMSMVMAVIMVPAFMSM